MSNASYSEHVLLPGSYSKHQFNICYSSVHKVTSQDLGLYSPSARAFLLIRSDIPQTSMRTRKADLDSYYSGSSMLAICQHFLEQLIENGAISFQT